MSRRVEVAVQVEQMRAFLVVAQEPSLRRAAARLHLSQPALGERLRGLERSLGVQLVARDRTGSRLTADGLRLLPLIERAVQAVDEVVRTTDAALVADGHGPEHVRIGVLLDGVEALTWPVVQAVQRWRSRPEVRLRRLTWREPVHAVLEGEVDAVLARGPFGDERTAVRTLAWSPLGVSMGAVHPLAGSAAPALSDVGRCGFVRPPTGMDSTFAGFWSLEDRFPGRLEIAVGSEDMDVHAVARLNVALGGVGLLPQHLAPVAAAAGAVFRPLAEDLRCPLQVLTAPRSRTGAAVAATAVAVARQLVPLTPRLTGAAPLV